MNFTLRLNGDNELKAKLDRVNQLADELHAAIGDLRFYGIEVEFVETGADDAPKPE